MVFPRFSGQLSLVLMSTKTGEDHFDKERDRVEPGPSPFIPDKVLTMCPEQGVNHVTG
jgi:hypothetical protein